MLLRLPKSNVFFGNTLMIFFARAFPSVANLLVIIGFSHVLPKDAYGSYSRFWIHLNLILPVITFGLHLVTVTYTPETLAAVSKSIKRVHLLGYAAWACTFGLLFAALQMHTTCTNFAIPLAFILIYAVAAIAEYVLTAFKNFTGILATNLFYSVVFVAIHLWVYKSNAPTSLIFSLLLPLIAIKAAIYLIMVSRGLREAQGEAFSAEVARRMRHLWLHLGVYDVSQNIFAWVDKFAVSLLLPPALTAIYFNGTQNIPFLPLLLSAAGNAVLIQTATTSATDDRRQAADLMVLSGKMLACIVFPLFFFFECYRAEFMVAVFSDKYVESIPLFAISLLILPLRAYSFTTLLQKFHRGDLINAGGLMDLAIACLLMYPLYHWFGTLGMAAAFVVSTYLQAGFYLFYSVKAVGLPVGRVFPLRDWVLKLVLFGGVFFLVKYFTAPLLSNWGNIFAGATLMVALVGSSLVREMNRHKQQQP